MIILENKYDCCGCHACVTICPRKCISIYLLHFFFLPNLKFLQPFLTTGNTVIIQLFVGITVSAAIITLCLLISNVFRSSNFLASWLFGVKPPPK